MNEEKHVYLVWTGEYSDKTVCGVFSTYERAEDFIKFLNKKDKWTEEELEKNFDYAYFKKEYRIQTVVLDAFSDEIEAGYSYFSGVMYFNRDSVIYEIPEEIDSYKSGEEWEIKRKQKELRFKISGLYTFPFREIK